MIIQGTPQAPGCPFTGALPEDAAERNALLASVPADHGVVAILSCRGRR